MFSKIWRFCAGLWPRKKRAVIVALAIVPVMAILISFPAHNTGSGSSPPAPSLAALEEMERNGRVVLAFEHTDAEELENKMAQEDSKHFTVRIIADNVVTEHRAASTDSVEELLKRAGVTLGEEDQLSHLPHRPVSRGDVIIVERWSRDTHTVEEEIPFKTENIPTSLLSSGAKSVIVEGQPGISLVTYSRRLKDGAVMEQTLESEEIVKSPVTRKVLVGTKGAPVSSLDFEWELDEKGVPVECAAVLEGQRAAGYSAKPGAGTASGRKAKVGNVAVNPKVIPYGSKLYIQSSDGSFVYGYAVAADTGTALMQGIIDVDLFYGTYTESVLNSIRTVDIYVLEYPK